MYGISPTGLHTCCGQFYFIILLYPWKHHTQRIVRKSIMTCWTDLNAHTEALHVIQGPAHCSDFRYTEDHQRKLTGFSSFAGQSLRCPEDCIYLSGFGLNHQSAQPLHIHFSHTSSTIIPITPNCWYVLATVPRTDLVLCIHFLD